MPQQNDAPPPRDRSLTLALDDALPVLLRPISAADKPLIAEGIRDLTDRSRQLRFFSWFKEAPDSLVEALANVDGESHIAWGALDLSQAPPRPIAAVHGFRDGPDGHWVELSCAVADAYQGRGLSQLLISAVFHDCARLGITTARAEVLPVNRPARHLFEGLGAERRETGEVMTYEMDIARALAGLAAPHRPRAIAQLRAHLEPTGPVLP